MAQSYAENQTVAGYFDDHSKAERALQELRDAGFTSAHVGVAHRGASSSSTGSVGSATSGAANAAHGVWDKVKNFFEGGVEPYADERTQGDLANREITRNPGDDYTYGRDDIHHSLTGMSVPQDRSRYLGDRFYTGDSGAIVTVKAGDRAEEAEEILRDNGADLGENATGYTGSNTGYESGPTGQAVETGRTGQVEDLQNVQLLGEVLRVHKDRISRGEVVVRKDVITETQTIQVPVTREELVIERVPVSGETQASGALGDSQEIHIPLTEETASIDKRTVVREEVSVGKKPVSEVRDLSGDVRREELVVDDQTRTRRAVNE
jgi:uncharacterized protein (TIGR02271 family)